MTQRTANLGSGCRGARPPRHRQPIRSRGFRQARLRRLSQVPGRLRLPSGCHRRDKVSASRFSSGNNPRQRAAAPGRAAIVRVPLPVRSCANPAGGPATQFRVLTRKPGHCTVTPGGTRPSRLRRPSTPPRPPAPQAFRPPATLQSRRFLRARTKYCQFKERSLQQNLRYEV